MGDEARLAVEHYGLEHPSHYMSVSYTVTPELGHNSIHPTLKTPSSPKTPIIKELHYEL